MKGFRFYLECRDRRKCVSTGNVIAVRVGGGCFVRRGKLCGKGLVRECSLPNSPVASASVPLEMLRKFCLRISEAKARQIHPELFQRLDHHRHNRMLRKPITPSS